MSFFSNLFFKNQNQGDAAILNVGMDMAMEFGEHFRQPIQKRLSEKFGNLTPEQLDHFNQECTTAMNAGNDFVSNLLENLSASNQSIRETDLKRQLKSFMTSRYPWINNDNVDRLYSQSCYYAFKNGFDTAIKS